MAEDGYLLFVWKTTGYELREQQGVPPAVGTHVQQDEGHLRVTKVGPSPLPHDPRPCAYVIA
jgi:hypothetical protein